MKMKKIILWVVCIIWTSIFLLSGGCGVRFKYKDYHQLENPVYMATRMDVQFIYNAWFNGSKNEGGLFTTRDARVLSPLALIDLPFAIAIDTVTLPFDWIVYSQNKKKKGLGKA